VALPIADGKIRRTSRGVGVLNPAIIHAFAAMHLARAKTDAAASTRRSGRFARAMRKLIHLAYGVLNPVGRTMRRTGTLDSEHVSFVFFRGSFFFCVFVASLT
jgi:hypothetical protein